jgi:carbon storage regulator
MLVLTRRRGETVHIGTEISVTVLAVDGNRIRIGIDAPREIPVWREELRQSLVGSAAALSMHHEEPIHADGNS